MRIGLLSDTHGLLRNELYGVFEAVDEILHAGDVGDPAILEELGVIAPVLAVTGNVDGWDLGPGVPEELKLERLGHKLAVIHGHQWGSPKVQDLIDRYPDYSVVVYGHTHEPLLRREEGVLVVNPGSAGHRRFNKPVSAGILTLAEGRPAEARLVDLLG